MSTSSSVAAGLSVQQVREFDEEGYLILKDVFDPGDLEPLRREIAERLDDTVRQLQAAGRISDTHANEPLERRLTCIWRDGRENADAVMRSLEGIAGGGHTGVEMFNLIRHPKLLAVVESLVGAEIVASSVYRIRPKLPGLVRSEVPWHQDSGYFDPMCDGSLVLTCWIPLVDANEENGCMQILPRAHRRGVVRHHTGGNGGLLVIKEQDLPFPAGQAITAACPLGGVVLMHNLIPHCSTANRSDVIRWSVDLRYQGADVPNNVDVWPEMEGAAAVQMACYPPEADFVVQSRQHPERVCSYEEYVKRRTHYDRVKEKRYPRRWTPLNGG
jgi:ectoine hydroxylase-related dioxygenase (phytanoyl-CoA dioxygenase family)